MAAKYPNPTPRKDGEGFTGCLLPAGPSVDEFFAWLRLHNHTPEPDEIIELYETVCELAGWNVPDKTPDVEVSKQPLKPALPADEAAKHFVYWAACEAREGYYNSAELTALYHEHARGIGHEPTPDNRLRSALRQLGIQSVQETTGMRAGNRKERRIRNMRWALFAPVSSVSRETQERLAA